MFSIIIPTYNRIKLLKKTLESIFQQEYPDYEVIVVNDGSTDGTDEYLTRFSNEGRIIYLKHQNRGPAIARKAGLDRARGDFIAFTDDDCILPPDWLNKFHEHFRQGSIAGVSGSSLTGNPDNIYAVTNDVINNYFKSVLSNRPGQAPYVTTNNVAYKRENLEMVGGPDDRFRMGAEDRELAYRVSKAGGRIVYDPSIVIGHYNDADFFGFVRHQYHQGQGSYLYYTVTAKSSTRPSSIPAGVYLGLLGHPFTLFPVPKAALVSILIILAQCSIVAGFAAAAFSSNPPPVKQ